MLQSGRNYCSFYIQTEDPEEPFFENQLGATSTKDYAYYNQLKLWKRMDRSFNYADAHCMTYPFRTGISWEKKLKPLIHERIDNSKNVLLLLSSITQETQQMNEEMDYCINVCGKPVIVVYVECQEQEEVFDAKGEVRGELKQLWDQAPVFRDNMGKVFVQHVPFNKQRIHEALNQVDVWLQNKIS